MADEMLTRVYRGMSYARTAACAIVDGYVCPSAAVSEEAASSWGRHVQPLVSHQSGGAAPLLHTL